jgi:putative addiction module component (TIGR02574 family)
MKQKKDREQVNMANDLIDRVLALPESERAALASRLLLSLGSADMNPDAEAAWATELEARLDHVEKGRFVARDWREVVADIRREITPKGPS